MWIVDSTAGKSDSLMSFVNDTDSLQIDRRKNRCACTAGSDPAALNAGRFNGQRDGDSIVSLGRHCRFEQTFHDRHGVRLEACFSMFSPDLSDPDRVHDGARR
jgi:hypothetical protein